jgi:hypothetical protein
VFLHCQKQLVHVSQSQSRTARQLLTQRVKPPGRDLVFLQAGLGTWNARMSLTKARAAAGGSSRGLRGIRFEPIYSHGVAASFGSIGLVVQ